MATTRDRGNNPSVARAIPRDYSYSHRYDNNNHYDNHHDNHYDYDHYRYDDHYYGHKHSGYIAPAHYYYGNYYYYYPQHIYPYGYGSFGIGFYYYNPYAWAPVAHVHYDGYAYGYGNGQATGELRLQVRPSNAEVYVDGYYAGQVDEFDGSSQGLRLEEGEYHIEIIAAGFEAIAFDVRVQPGRKINYRGDMFPVRPASATYSSLP